MRLEQLFHIACAVANVPSVIFGANALLPWLRDFGLDDMRQFLDPTMVSRELDLCVSADETLNTLVDGAIGELSYFDATFGVYAHPNPLAGLFHAPSSWMSRQRIEREPVSGVAIIVPHYSDLAVSKLIAGREKDMEFVRRVLARFDLSVAQIEALLREYDAERPQPPPVALRHLSRLSVFAAPPQASCHPPEPARSMPTPHS